jgi:L-ascorbate metabolism protein UlaG (beta-lactamase superfamily)
MKKKKVVFLAFILICHLFSMAQSPATTNPDTKTDWWGDVEGYLNQQAKVTLQLAGEALLQSPPALVEPMQRKMALIMIDNVMHEQKAPTRPAVQEFLQQRIQQAISEICSEKVTKGAVIWKLYDHAFVVKTATVTIGFDVQRGVPSIPGFTLPKEMMQKLIDRLDILFISHHHGDHADPWMAEMLLQQNKPVVTPPNLWPAYDFYARVTHPERKAGLLQEIELPGKGIKLRFYANPGHQGEDIPNNVTVVATPEGITFAHTGDQSNLGDFSWIDKAGDVCKVDVLMTNSWSVYPDHRLVRGFRPRLTLPGHENEMGHTIDHREPYWLNYNRLGDPKIFPWIQMAWGEKYHYRQRK